MNLKEIGERYMGVFKGRKEKGEILCLYYNLKNKVKNDNATLSWYMLLMIHN